MTARGVSRDAGAAVRCTQRDGGRKWTVGRSSPHLPASGWIHWCGKTPASRPLSACRPSALEHVSEVGFEPTRHTGRRILSPLRLPFRHSLNEYTGGDNITSASDLMPDSMNRWSIESKPCAGRHAPPMRDLPICSIGLGNTPPQRQTARPIIAYVELRCNR